MAITCVCDKPKRATTGTIETQKNTAFSDFPNPSAADSFRAETRDRRITNWEKRKDFFQQSRNPISSLIIKWEKAKRVEDNTLNNSHQNKRLGYPKK